MNREKKIIIRLNQGEEHRVRLGCVYESDSFFYDSYRRGADILKEILEVSGEIRKRSSSYNDECIGTEDDNTYEFPNNIIAFCGERGEGKTSAMRTFAHALENLHNTKKNCSPQDVEAFWGWRIETYKFFVLPVIDPTMMREQDSFMRIILSRMFAQLRCYLEQENLIGKNQTVSYTQRKKFNSDQLEKIITGFRECYAYLDTLSKKPDIDNRNDDLEEIANLGDSGSLRGKFRQLVRDYLKLMSSDRGVDEEDVYLVMQIDDADLNMRQAYNILEDIRNFCLVPEVVILMAMDIKQLYQIIEQHYVCDFELLLKYGDSPFLLNECRGMAVKYIDKVIPGSRQIYLPKINEVIKDEYADFSIQYFAIRDEEKEDVFDKSITDYQERLLVWLNKKTGMVFVKPFTYRHNFLPGYLRELAHFLVYFEKMADLNPQYKLAQIYSLLRGSDAEMPDDWKKKREEAFSIREKWLQNLRNLEQYFLKNWGELHLSREGEESLLKLSEAADTMKPLIIDSICDSLELKILGSYNNSFMLEKYSYGYLMKRLDLLSHEVRREEDYCLLYALRFYYSLHVYKRLLALAGDAISYRHFPENYGFVTWVPDYFRSGNYFSYGRFEVNLYALGKLCKEFSDTKDRKELLERVSKIFYIVSDSGKVRSICDSDLDILLKSPVGSSKLSIHVMFDLGYFLFSIVSREDGLYWLPYEKGANNSTSWQIRMKFINMVFQLLFNWDIQHYIEKMADSRNLSRPGISNYIPIDLETWFIKYWHDIASIIADNSYLKQMSVFIEVDEESDLKYEDFIRRMVPSGFGSILYGNEEYARSVLFNYKEKIGEGWAGFEKAKSDVSSKMVALDGLIRLLLSESKTIKCDLLEVEVTMYDRISNQWKTLSEKMNSGDLECCESLMKEDSQLVKDCKDLMSQFENKVTEKYLDSIFGKKNSRRRRTATT